MPTESETEEARGVAAIIYLQARAGITESEAKAKRGWAGMSAHEREFTLGMHQAMLDYVAKRAESQPVADPIEDQQKRDEVGIEKMLTSEPCEDCGTLTGVEHIPCPYASDIDGDDTLHWLCNHCAGERANDI